MTTRQPAANGTAVRLKVGVFPGSGNGSMSVMTTKAAPSAKAPGAAQTARPYNPQNQAIVQAPAVRPCQTLYSVSMSACARIPTVAGYRRLTATLAHVAVAKRSDITGCAPAPSVTKIWSCVASTNTPAHSQSRCRGSLRRRCTAATLDRADQAVIGQPGDG